MKNFSEADLPPALLDRLDQMGFTTPTPIQAEAIPLVLQGKDILASAQTGTGKTGAYGIPLVTQLLNSSHGSALILLPTRELAVQVMLTLKKFIGRSKIATALLIGGEPMPNQLRQLRCNPDLIVGTPGRVFDHINRGTLGVLKKTNMLILDEADRMLDMGFGIQIQDIVRNIPSNRQTLMFSATLPQNIKNLSAKYLTDPVRISIGSSHSPAANVTQSQVKLTDAEKYPRLVEELQQRTGSKIVFVKTKRTADRMALKLRKDGQKVDALHGDLRQNQRNRVIAKFRKQSFDVLVATDVAARGLDIPHIEHVINYDLPQQPEDYIHRIGRTARAGATGEALNFISPSERKQWSAIQHLLNPGEKHEGFAARKGKKRNYQSDGQRGRQNSERGRGGYAGRSGDSSGRSGGGGYAGRSGDSSGRSGGGGYAGRSGDSSSRSSGGGYAGRSGDSSSRSGSGGYAGRSGDSSSRSGSGGYAGRSGDSSSRSGGGGYAGRSGDSSSRSGGGGYAGRSGDSSSRSGSGGYSGRSGGSSGRSGSGGYSGRSGGSSGSGGSGRSGGFSGGGGRSSSARGGNR